ncbi:hypothetical protein STAL104432_09980 [Streptomyces albus]
MADTTTGTTTWPATFVAVRIMSRIGSMASSRPTPSRGRPRVERVRVSITVAPVRPAVAAEPMTDTKTISRYSLMPMSTWKNSPTKMAAMAG